MGWPYSSTLHTSSLLSSLQTFSCYFPIMNKVCTHQLLISTWDASVKPPLFRSQLCFSQFSSDQSSPSTPAFTLSQHQGLFQWFGSLHQVAKGLEFQLQHQSSQWIFRVISLMIDWWDLLAVHGTLKGLLQHHSSRAILWCSSPWASLRTTYTEEEGPLLTTSLPTGEIWASWSSQEKKKIFPKCNHGSLFLVVKTHLKYLMRCQPATAEKWHVLTTTYLLILEFTSCDKYPARYEVFLLLLFHVI